MTWTLIASRHYPIFSRQWVISAFHEEQKQSLSMGINNYKSLYNGMYADEGELEELKKLIISKIRDDPKQIWQIAVAWEKECNTLLKYTNKLKNLDFSKFRDEQLTDLLTKAVLKLRKSASYIFLHHAIDEYFEKWLNGLLNAKIKSQSKREAYFHILATTSRKTKLLEARKELEKLAYIVKKKGYGASEAQIKRYASNYKWMGYDTAVGHDFTVDEVKSNIESVLAHSKASKLEKIKSISKKRVMHDLNLTPQEKDIINLIDFIIFLPSLRAECHMIAGSHIRPLLEEIARRFGVSYDTLTQFTIDEIKSAFPKKQLDLEESKKRSEKFGLLMVDGKLKIYSGKDVDKIDNECSLAENMQELKGQIANYGHAKGKAKIVLSNKDFGKVELGDILVTKMTNPDYIMVLEKCSAIITDIGGITSHAAIISRELNKPCIIGTKVATKILKDGDLIEVDADLGVIKKIS